MAEEGGGGGILREILAAFEITVDDKELEKAGEKIEGFVGKLKALGSVIGEAFEFELVREFVEHQVEAATELERTAIRLGLTTEKLQEYQLAAGLAGVRSESLTVGMRYLERAIGEAGAKGGQAGAVFQKLGIHLKEGGKSRETGDVLEDLAEKFASIQAPAERTRLAMELFGRQGAALIPLLAKGREGFAEARKEMEELGGPTSKEVIEGAKKVEEAQVRLNFVMGRVKETIAVALFPVFEKLITWFTDGVKAFKELTSHSYAVETALEVLGVAAGYKALVGLEKLLRVFGLLKPSILETLAALGEFLVPIVIVGALYLIFDDLYTLMKGGQSVIGETLDQLFGVGTAASFVEFLNDSVAFTIDLFEGLAQIIAGVVIPIFVTLWEIVKGLLTTLYDIVTLNFADIGKDLTESAKSITNAWAAGWETIKKGGLQTAGLGPDAHPFAAGVARGFGGTIGANPNAPTREPTSVEFGRQPQQGHVREPVTVQFGPGAHPTNVTMHQQVNNRIEVHTASDDPHPIGEAVGQGVATHTERAASNALQNVKRT